MNTPIRVRALTDAERRAVAKLRATPNQRIQLRADIVWLSARSRTTPQIARNLGCSQHTVRLWIHRFNAQGLDGLRDAPRPGRPRKLSPHVRAQIVYDALLTRVASRNSAAETAF